MAIVISFERAKLRREAARRKPGSTASPWSWRTWPLCRIRYFVQTTAARRSPGNGDSGSPARAGELAAIIDETLVELECRGGTTATGFVAALLAHPELTAAERAALSTGPCEACPVLAERTQQLRFLWGLYRAYWKRATTVPSPRHHQGHAMALESRQSAVELRSHIRHEISLIRHLQRNLARCPWSRHGWVSHANRPLLGC